jgi:hypothetical protein
VDQVCDGLCVLSPGEVDDQYLLLRRRRLRFGTSGMRPMVAAMISDATAVDAAITGRSSSVNPRCSARRGS